MNLALAYREPILIETGAWQLRTSSRFPQKALPYPHKKAKQVTTLSPELRPCVVLAMELTSSKALLEAASQAARQ